jgi:hypothetical protein
MDRRSFEPIWAELRGIVSCEEALAASLVHLSATAEDPREAVWLRRRARDCHGHARTLRRHLELSWMPAKPGFGERRPEVLVWARDVSRCIARNLRWCRDQPVDPYTRTLLRCMAEDHERLGHDLELLVGGEMSYADEADLAPVLDLLRRPRRGLRMPEFTTVRRGA